MDQLMTGEAGRAWAGAGGMVPRIPTSQPGGYCRKRRWSVLGEAKDRRSCLRFVRRAVGLMVGVLIWAALQARAVAADDIGGALAGVKGSGPSRAARPLGDPEDPLRLEIRGAPSSSRIGYAGAVGHPELTVFAGADLVELSLRRRALFSGPPAGTGIGEISFSPNPVGTALFRAEAGSIRHVFGRTPIATSTVRMSGLDGTLVQSVVADPDGYYRFDLPGDLPAEYRLVVTGGVFAGKPFVGRLETAFRSSHDRASANVTWLTALLQAAADTAAGPGGDSISRREALISQLAVVSALSPTNWSGFHVDGVSQGRIAESILGGGMAAAASRIAEESAAADLGAVAMGWFPRAHGGILRRDFQTVAINGEMLLEALEVETTGVTTNRPVLSLLQGPQGMQVNPDGRLAWLVPSTQSAGSVPFTVRAMTPGSNAGRTLTGTIQVTAAEVAVSGVVGPEGGALTDAWADVVVRIPPGALDAPTQIRLLRFRDAEGRLSFQIDSGEGIGTLKLPAEVAIDPLNQGLSLGAGPRRNAQLAGDPLVWQDGPSSWYLQENAQGWVHRIPLGYPIPVLDGVLTTKTNSAYRVESVLPRDEGSAYAGRTPIIFVHGYHPKGELGSTQSTWGRFLELIAAEEGGHKYLPVAFNWRTNQRFQDAAADLAGVIDYLARLTGKKVHLVAHSFGGLTCRTYLQGLATKKAYRDDVAGLVTLGTPHSGIFFGAGRRFGFDFPDGTDGFDGNLLILGAAQISAFQAGQALAFEIADLLGRPIDLRGVLGIHEGERGYWVGRLAQLDQHPLHTPTLVLMGLRARIPLGSGILGCQLSRFENGDGLISLGGQRFHPSQNGLRVPAAVAYSSATGSQVQAPVTERFIGFSNAAWPGELVRGADIEVSGCDWTSVVLANDPRIKEFALLGISHTPLQMAHLSEVKVENSSHPSYQAVLSWIRNDASLPVIRTPFRLEATVVDAQTSQPIPSAQATVEVGGRPQPGVFAISGPDGRVVFPDLTFNPATEFSVVVSATGYRTERSMTVRTGQTAPTPALQAGNIPLWRSITVPSTGPITVRVVRAADGAAVSGASVQIQNPRNLLGASSGVSGSTGEFVSSNLPGGNYQLTVEATGYQTDSQLVLHGLTTGTSVTVRLVQSGRLMVPAKSAVPVMSGIWVTNGQVVSVHAAGMWRIGNTSAIELTTADGIAGTGLDFNYARGCELGRLIAVINESRYCVGASSTFTATSTGYLGFICNDRIDFAPPHFWEDNSGFVEVAISLGGSGRLIQSLSVPATCDCPVLTAPLQAGIRYLVEASDIYNYAGGATADAAGYASSYGWGHVPLSEGYGKILHIGCPDIPWWDMPFSPDHIYRSEVIGQGRPLELRIVDVPGLYGDNAGSLEIRIIQMD